MATEYAVRTFEDILNAILERAKIASNTATAEAATLSTLKRFVNDRYHNVSFSKKWDWREENRKLPLFATTPASALGYTFTFTNQSRNFVSSAALFTVSSDWINTKVYSPSGQYLHTIIGIQSSTIALLDSLYVGATETSEAIFFFTDSYGLFPDYADMIEVTPIGSNYACTRPLTPVSSEEMAKLQAVDPVLESLNPTYYTIADNDFYNGPSMGEFVMGYDFMGTPKTPRIVFYPGRLTHVTSTIDFAAPVNIKYGLQITPLVEATDQPLIPFEKRRVLVYGALADWFALQNKDDQSKLYEDKFTLLLSNMKADFDKSEVRVKLVPQRRGRTRLSIYPRSFPEVS